MSQVDLNGQVFEQDQSGNWIHKAEQSKFKTKDGKLKAQYKDLPRYKLIYTYEDFFRSKFNQTLRAIAKDLKTKMNNLIE